MVNDQLAGKEMNIGRYYLRQGDTLAAINRFKGVIERYQTTSHAPEALYRLVEGYLTLGLADEAKKNGAVLGYNYPGDPWYGDAYKLLTSSGLKPAVEPAARGRHGLFHVPFRRDKEDTIKPPAAAAQTTADATPAAKTEAAPAAATETAKPKKKRTLFHPFG
jgi:outer membrane protein assembly factor BamD